MDSEDLVAVTHLKHNTISQATGVKKISDRIQRRRWKWIGHVLRKERYDDCMVVMEWQPEGKKEGKELKPQGEGQWEKNPDKRDGPAGQKSGAQWKAGLVGERKLQLMCLMVWREQTNYKPMRTHGEQGHSTEFICVWCPAYC